MLVDVFALHLVGRHGVPPEKLVSPVGGRLQQGLGDVHVTTVFDDFTVNQLGNLGHGVVLRAVQFEGLTSGGVVVEHALETGADVNGLYN